MAILSKKLVGDVNREYQREHGLRLSLMDLSGRVVGGRDRLSGLPGLRRRRDYALQESVNMGTPHVFLPVRGLATWVVGLEDRRMVHGGLLGGEVLVKEETTSPELGVADLVSHGMAPDKARELVGRLPSWPSSRVQEAAQYLQDAFYRISGWKPELMKENRLRVLQQEQINQAIEDQRRHGKHALYAFEKERVLLANIRAGDRNEARKILNEMLATIYMSSPRLVVLRARTIELMSCLTRAAIEDNPLMEPLIERNHAWTERLVKARSFEDLSHVLMKALDDFIDGIYLHGMNRSSIKVRRALDFIGKEFGTRITVQMVADEAELSPGRVSHLVKEFTGRTVLQIVQQVRVRHAQQLLEQTSKSCTEIAYEVGFGDQSYFIKHFKRLTGTTPARYRQFLRVPRGKAEKMQHGNGRVARTPVSV